MTPHRALQFDLQNSLSSSSFHPSRKDIENVHKTLETSWAKSTHSSYARNLKHFHRFCSQRNIPPESRFPTSESLLLIYAASHVGICSSSTVRHRLSALKAYHVIHNWPWNGSPRLSKLLRGLKLSAPDSSSRPPRPPISLSMLIRLLKRLNLRDPFDAAVAACASTAFWGQCRLGELLPRSSNVTHSSSIPTRSHLTCSASKSRPPQSFNLHLPQTKTNRLGQTVTILPRDDASNPLPLLQNHLFVNHLPIHVPLFSYCPKNHASPHTRILSKPAFLARCNAILNPLGYKRISGHSFRIGGTTTLLASGIPSDVVKTMGRWSSDSFLRYWRHIDRIAPAQAPPHTPRPGTWYTASGGELVSWTAGRFLRAGGSPVQCLNFSPWERSTVRRSSPLPTRHGGYGFTSRAWGLTLDTIQSLEIVLANGSIVTTSSLCNADLFWALRGASSSFGIVTSMTASTFPAPPSVTSFLYVWDVTIEQATTSVLTYQGFALSPSTPSNLGLYLVLTKGSQEGKVGMWIMGAYYGPPSNFNSTLAPLLCTFPETNNKTVSETTYIKSVEILGFMGRLNTTQLPDEPNTFYAKSLMTPEGSPMTREMVEAWMKYLGKQGFSADTVWYIEIELYGGPTSKINQIPFDSSSFGKRDTLFTIQLYTSSSN
ncbi:hypothetical protein CVT24_002553, partial [Panaeolus cyanescens]